MLPSAPGGDSFSRTAAPPAQPPPSGGAANVAGGRFIPQSKHRIQTLRAPSLRSRLHYSAPTIKLGHVRIENFGHCILNVQFAKFKPIVLLDGLPDERH